MSLRSKIVLLLFGIFALYLVVDQLVQRSIVLPSFVELEEQAALQDVQQVRDVIRREVQKLSSQTGRWATNDAIYDFARNRTPGFVDSYIRPGGLDQRYDLISIFTPQGDPVWGRLINPVTGQPLATDEAQPVAATGVSLPPNHPILRAGTFDRSVDGLLVTQHGPMMIAARPILMTGGTGPVAGILVLGRLLNDERVSMLNSQFNGALQLVPILPDQLTRPQRSAVARIRRGQNVLLDQAGSDQLLAYMGLSDIFGNDAVLLQAMIPREISLKGMVATRIATFTVMAAGVTILIIVWLVMQQQVVQPLRRLTDQAIAVGKGDRVKSRLNLRRNDEIGVLAREFDHMIERVADSHARELENAHHAGMAEIATEVLHNVGNALNSVNVSSEMLSERLAKSHLQGLRQASELLEQNRDNLAEFFANDQRGVMLLEYLVKVTGAVSNEQTGLQDEVKSLRERVAHIKTIIDTQQSYASNVHFVQNEDLHEIVDDALRVHQETGMFGHMLVEREFDYIPLVPVNKSRLMQVLVNLVKNAAEAMDADDSPDNLHRIIVRVMRANEEEVVIEIEDTGPGLDSEQLGNVFRYGYTTKPTGKGFGLHFCANAAQEMGGRVSVTQAKGHNRGCCFSVYLPLQHANVEA